MLKVVLFSCLALVACKKEKKSEPQPGSASAATTPPADKPPEPAAASGSAPAAGSEPAAGSAAAGSGSATAAAETFEPKWEKYESKEGKFTIEFPSTPTEQSGQMKMVTAQFGKTAKDDREATCGVVFLDFPPDAKVDAKAALEGGTASHKQNATVIEDKDVKLDGSPGKSVVVKNDKHQKWVRMYVVKKRLYVLTCGGPSDRGETDNVIATKTLDSFKLTK